MSVDAEEPSNPYSGAPSLTGNFGDSWSSILPDWPVAIYLDCYCNGRMIENRTNRRRRLRLLVSDFGGPLPSRSLSCCLELSSIDPWVSETQPWGATGTLAPNPARLQHDNVDEVGNVDHNEGSACCRHLNSDPDGHLPGRGLGSLLRGSLWQPEAVVYCQR